MSPRRASKPRDERSALAGSLRTRRTAFPESAAALAARTQERIFAPQVTRRWPHMAPWRTQTV